MTTASIGLRRLGFGAFPGDHAPADISSAKKWCIDQLSSNTSFVASDLFDSAAALDAFVARARSKGTAAYKAFTNRVREDITARISRIVDTNSPLLERVSLHWLNFFTTAIGDQPLGLFLSSYEQEAIRPYMLGQFSKLLTAVTTHPAMLIYLNNRQSVGPNSARNIRANDPGKRGLNENHARELLELHTLGVDGGYTQDDIVELAKAMTGWTIDVSPRDTDPAKRLGFHLELHEPGPRKILSHVYPPSGPNQLKSILHDLAHHPNTAKRVCRSMASHFIGDEAPTELLNNMIEEFFQSDGDLKRVTAAMIQHDAIWTTEPKKIRPPVEYIGSVARFLGRLPSAPPLILSVKAMGQPYFAAPAPTGWPDGNDAWTSPEAIKSRLDWAYQFAAHSGVKEDPELLLSRAFGNTVSEATKRAVLGAADAAQALTLLIMSPEFIKR